MADAKKPQRGKVNRIDHSEKSKGYRYKDKDPILYLILHLIDESGISDAKISRISGVTTHTLNRWRYENVRKPQFPTLRAVLKAIDMEFAAVGPTGNVVRVGTILDVVEATYPLKRSK